jgi:hypothetical protein
LHKIPLNFFFWIFFWIFWIFFLNFLGAKIISNGDTSLRDFYIMTVCNSQCCKNFHYKKWKLHLWVCSCLHPAKMVVWIFGGQSTVPPLHSFLFENKSEIKGKIKRQLCGAPVVAPKRTGPFLVLKRLARSWIHIIYISTVSS